MDVGNLPNSGVQEMNNPVLRSISKTHSQIQDVISKQTLEPVSDGGLEYTVVGA